MNTMDRQLDARRNGRFKRSQRWSSVTQQKQPFYLVQHMEKGGKPQAAVIFNGRGRRLLAVLLAVAAVQLSACVSIPKGEISWQGPISRKREERRQKAVAEFEAARNEAEFKSALNLWDRNNIKGCEEALRSLLSRVPDHRDARLLLLDVCLAKNDLAEAARQTEALLADYPDDAHVQFSAALALDAVGRCDQALIHYRKAVSLAPENQAYRAGYYAAREAANRRQARTGDPISDLAAGLVPPADDAEAIRPAVGAAGYAEAIAASSLRRVGSRSAAEDRSGSDYTDPIDQAAGAESAEDAIARGRLALSRGDLAVAAEWFRQAMMRSPDDSRTAVSAAAAALRYEQPALAVQVLQSAAVRFPQHVQVHQTLGIAYYRLGDYHAAQEALEKALSLDKSNALSYFLMGCTLAKAGRSAAAENYLRQAEAIDPRWTARR